MYNLPQGGSLKQWGIVCPVQACGFEMSLYVVGHGKEERCYPICPNCYNHPREEWGPAPSGKGLCLECPHPDRSVSLEGGWFKSENSDTETNRTGRPARPARR